MVKMVKGLCLAKELEKAAERFSLGEGACLADRYGQGSTVFKGMLADGRIVAVKKSRRRQSWEVHK